jgi:ParB-like chromosome segregation protein Spo0J
MHEDMRPIVVDEGGEIITGHSRYEAAIKLGVPVQVADSESPSAGAEENHA